ncbi:LOW QUALITY PROTEIN: uncharacterized protein LOC135468857 [Liolophura sinensis]|uniref:LOW QUALITY PROTEIN: uncharacterized protein LOC135468857 n=1 Tax=Liolophura sinensis TaxID=3198878 RepID=UPI0031583E07
MSVEGSSVAIVGGGISGLVCAVRLGQLGIRNTTVFDTGKNAPGGRCSSRLLQSGQTHYVFDHSTQYFTVTDQRFSKIVSYLHAKGAVKIWTGPIGHLRDNGQFEKDQTLTQAFVGTGGMCSIPQCLASMVHVRRPVWVGEVVWEEGSKKWNVGGQGYFDYLVIAHNGKCADRLMANAGVPRIHKLLQVRFGSRLVPKDLRMQLCSLWVLLAIFPTSLKLKYQGAHVDGGIISWVANNTAKLSAGTTQSTGGSCVGQECWTVFSTRDFAATNKVPQENIPPSKRREVTNKLLSEFGRVTGLGDRLPKPSKTFVQLWGAAVPMNTLETSEECVFDGLHHVGVCGDWLVSPCIQGAAISGLALAEHIHKHASGLGTDSPLLQKFRPASSEMIGAFPTDPNMMFNPKK